MQRKRLCGSRGPFAVALVFLALYRSLATAPPRCRVASNCIRGALAEELAVQADGVSLHQLRARRRPTRTTRTPGIISFDSSALGAIPEVRGRSGIQPVPWWPARGGEATSAWPRDAAKNPDVSRAKLLVLLLALVILFPAALLAGWRLGCSGSVFQAGQRENNGPSPAADRTGVAPAETDHEGEFLRDLRTLKTSVAVASLAHLGMSYNAAVVAGAMLSMKEDPRLAPIDAFIAGAVVSFLLAGACVGAGVGFVADHIGRKATLELVFICYVAGAALMACAPNVYWLCAGRIVAGFGVGLSSVSTNLYISEVSPPGVRGQLGAWAPMFGTAGMMLSYVASAVLGGYGPSTSWRLQLVFGAAPSVMALFLRGYLVESPAWLAACGRGGRARVALQRLFPEASASAVAAEVGRLSGGQDVSLQRDCGDVRCVSQPAAGAVQLLWDHRRPLGIGVAINVMQQICGINVLVYYGPTVLEMAGLDKDMALLMTVAVAAVQVITVLASSLLVDRLGRRMVMIGGIIAVGLGLAMLMGGFVLHGARHPRDRFPWAAGALTVGGTLVFRVAFSFSLGPLPFIMTTELFPQSVRALGSGACWVANWLASGVVCQTFPLAVEALQAQFGEDFSATIVFGIYLALTAASLVFVYVSLPETAGVRLDSVRV